MCPTSSQNHSPVESDRRMTNECQTPGHEPNKIQTSPEGPRELFLPINDIER